MRSHEHPAQAAEAAGYALLRRLAPALKHDLVVHLQSVTMMSEVMGARLERESGLPAQLREQVSRLHHLARDAVASSLRVTHWLNPPDDQAVSLTEGITQTLDLIRKPLGFRGFALTQRVTGPLLEVARSQLQPLLAATILYLSDLASAPRVIDVEAKADHASAQLTVSLGGRSTAGNNDGSVGGTDADVMTDADADADAGADTTYRALRGADLRALAETAGLVLTEQADRVSIVIARLETTAPLGIAPR